MNTSYSTAPTPKAMRSNRTGRTTDNRLFRWNGRFFFTFQHGIGRRKFSGDRQGD